MQPPKEAWLENLPTSRMVRPTAPQDRFKYWIWRLYTPFHSTLRDIAHHLYIVRHEGRQDFLIGKLNPIYSAKEFVSALIGKGFGNDFVAWRDSGELISLRKTSDFSYQYHIRLFRDGEVRCHFEYTPESHPVRHMKKDGQEERREEFERILGDLIIPIPDPA